MNLSFALSAGSGSADSHQAWQEILPLFRGNDDPQVAENQIGHHRQDGSQIEYLDSDKNLAEKEGNHQPDNEAKSTHDNIIGGY